MISPSRLPRRWLRSTLSRTTFRVPAVEADLVRPKSAGGKAVRIGNGCGFWGDNLDAPVLLAEQGRLDYLTLEYLAELTMSILARQKQRDPEAGFATDFLDVLKRPTPSRHAQPNLKIITNAGGMNPAACAVRARAILDKAGLTTRTI